MSEEEPRSKAGMKATPPDTPMDAYKKEFGTTLVIGGTGGLGGALVKRLAKSGVKLYVTCRKVKSGIDELNLEKIIDGIDLMDANVGKRLIDAIGDVSFDTVIVVAGYFTLESFGEFNIDEERKMYGICSIGTVNLIDALYKANKFHEGTRIGALTSEGGSIGLRTEKEGGGNYGHHGSKAAQNMVFKMLSYDLKPMGVPVVMIHPGMIRSKMTENKFGDKYDELDAVYPNEAAPYILDCIARLKLDTTGQFVAAMGTESLGMGIMGLEGVKLPHGATLPW